MLGSRSYFPKVPADTPLDEVVQSFLLQFYLSGQGDRQIPSEVLLDVALEDESVIADTPEPDRRLHKGAGGEPDAQREARFIKLASINAQTALRSRLAHRAPSPPVTISWRGAAGAPRATIARMECFDISHTMGSAPWASCVVFNRGAVSLGIPPLQHRRYHRRG